MPFFAMLTIQQLQDAIATGTNIIDIRPMATIENGFLQSARLIPAYHVPTIEWVLHSLYYPAASSIVITDDTTDPETLQFLTEWNEGIALPQWQWNAQEATAKLPMDFIIAPEADEFALDVKHDKSITVIDLRSPAEYQKAHLANSIQVDWQMSGQLVQEFELDDKLYLIAPTPAIALSVASLLRANGFNFIRPLADTFSAIENTPLDITRPKRKK